MIRTNLKKITMLPAFLPFGVGDVDVVSKDIKTVKEADLSIMKDETGWDRLRQVFSKDDFGRIGPELNSIIQVAWMSSLTGALYGGVVNSREAYIDFIKNNQATAFRDHLEAKKKLQDQVTLSFGKGAFKWGWRLSLFSTTYITISTSIAAYRGRNGILEHLGAGALSGITYKLQMGPRGWIVGGGLGLVLGGIAGVVTSSLLSLTGMTMEEVRYWNYKWMKSRNESFEKGLKEHLEKEQLQILTERDAKLGKSSLLLDDLEKDVKINNPK